ncbi:DNA polymerase III subunit gamma/tau [Candidatus Vondammii sp. HM_W22]|uniref:DNA polymerase III subunit gamma/tau n=1 Tax=Candidatus Vondammii sp. HM_W22 TaxID=2687299 RepID=UPI001F136AF0|nr:DNA polymerase III subunit gamma/tau [Candidatus Vondammii sp. HM_W22]
MSYQVLARKWRPRIFSELVGQDHVVRALSNALDNDRLHHAYLFTGTRGVGKTTLARIFAKSLNCEHGVGSTPCGQCSICQEVDEGRFVDLLEVDAASRTKVDQTRELLDNVPYAPVRGRYKVYLIDEVHMFSDSSFNALLKTLEEPPPHVKFLLATTDPQKVPMTVLSRCLQFNLKRISLERIKGYLQTILEKEGIKHDLGALTLIARGADGSMRDALSLLDQAIAFGNGQVVETDVRTMLGSVAQDRVYDLLHALGRLEAGELMGIVANLADMAPDFTGVVQDLLSLLHRIALVQAVPGALDNSTGDLEQVEALAAELAQEDVQLFYQIGLMGQRDLPLAPHPRVGFEMILLRMLAFRPDTAPALQDRKVSPATGTNRVARPEKKKRPDTPPPVNQKPAVATPKATRPAAPPPVVPVDLSRWNQVVESLDLGGIARQLANNCVYESWNGSVLTLKLDPTHQHMQVGSTEQRLQKALVVYMGQELQLKIEPGSAEVATPAKHQAEARADRQREAEITMAADPLVCAMADQMGAQLIPGSVRPVDD